MALVVEQVLIDFTRLGNHLQTHCALSARAFEAEYAPATGAVGSLFIQHWVLIILVVRVTATQTLHDVQIRGERSCRHNTTDIFAVLPDCVEDSDRSANGRVKQFGSNIHGVVETEGQCTMDDLSDRVIQGMLILFDNSNVRDQDC